MIEASHPLTTHTYLNGASAVGIAYLGVCFTISKDGLPVAAGPAQHRRTTGKQAGRPAAAETYAILLHLPFL